MKTYLASAMLLLGASVIGLPALAAETGSVPVSPGSAASMAPAASPSAPAEQTGAGAAPVTKEQIVGHALIDKNGAKIGTVKDVKTNASGAATDLVVSVGKKDVLLPASEVQIASNDQIQTSRTAKDVKRLPAADMSTPSDDMGATTGKGATPGSAGTLGTSGGGAPY